MWGAGNSASSLGVKRNRGRPLAPPVQAFEKAQFVQGIGISTTSDPRRTRVVQT